MAFSQPSAGGVEAGPSSSVPSGRNAGDDDPSQTNLQSFRQIYYALESPHSSAASVTALHDRLKQLVPRLKKICDPIPPSSAASAADVEAGKATSLGGKPIRLDKSLVGVVKQCATFYNVDEAEVATSMRAYLDSDESDVFQLTGSSLDAALPSASIPASKSSSRQRGKKLTRTESSISETLVDALSVFFFEEKLYALRCVNALLRIGDDTFHDLNAVAEDIVRQFVDHSFSEKCLARMESLCNEPLNEKIREVPRYSTYWANFTLRLQLALLEVVFLIFYSRLDSNAKFVETVHLMAQRTNFGRRQINEGFFDRETGTLLNCISHLFVLLCLESLDLERIIDGLDFFGSPNANRSDTAERKQLIDVPDTVGTAIDFLRTSTIHDRLRGPLLIAWALLVSRIETAHMDWLQARPTEPVPARLIALVTVLDGRGGAGQVWTELVTAALDSNLELFTTLSTIARSPLISWHAASKAVVTLALSSSLAMRAVLKGLILSITELVKPEYITDYAGFVQVWQYTFTNEDVDHRVVGQASDSAAALCAQYWQVDFEHEQRRSLLLTATRRFPVSFRPLIRLCRALSGSGPGALHTSDEALQASSAVLDYLATLQTITQVLPSTPTLSAPYEPLVDEAEQDATLTYRSTREIHVFGRHLVIPKGTLGRIISVPNQVPVVMVWQLSRNDGDKIDGYGRRNSMYSAWRLMRDILARFAGLLDRKDEFAARSADESGDASVFVDKIPPANFNTLAIDEEASSDGDAAADIMDLFASILATESNASASLMAHLDGDDPGDFSVYQPTSLDGRRAKLVNITLAILNQALASPAAASRVIISAYRLLTLSVSASRFEEAWISLRSSGLLAGTHGIATNLVLSSSGLTSSYKTTTLLKHETSIGRYAGLLALLNFHLALLADFQQSAYALDQGEADMRVEVLLRALEFVVDKVWLSYQGWKYVRLRERIEIGRKCVRFFSSILSDDSLLYCSSATARLRSVVEDLFVGESASPLLLNPLLHVIASGQAFVSRLQQATRLFEIELAREQVEACLAFATLVVDRRRGLNLASIGVIERAFVEDTRLRNSVSDGTVVRRSKGSQSVDLATIVMSGALSPLLTVASRVESVKLTTSVCRSLVENASGTSVSALISHLGSLSDVETLLKGLISIVDDEGADVELRLQTWNMLSALTESQPGIATLLLTGKHVASIAFMSEGVSTTSSDKIIERTAMDVALESTQQVKGIASLDTSLDRLKIVEASLKFLRAAWEYATEHRKEFEAHRQSKDFWNGIMAIAIVQTSVPSTEPRQIEVASGYSRTDVDADVIRFALIKSCSTVALQLLAADIRISPTCEAKHGQARKTPSPSLTCVTNLLQDQKKVSQSIKDSLQVQCDPLRHLDVLERIRVSLPELRMDDFRLTARMDDFDLRKKYGCDYVYDIRSFHFKLQGLMRSSIANGQDEMTLDADAVEQATLLIAGLNLDWTAIDLQSINIRAWSALLSTAIGPLFDRMQDDAAFQRELQRKIGRTWAECAAVVTVEEVATTIVQDIHALRMSLLANLLDLAWSLPGQASNRRSKDDYDGDEREIGLAVMQQAVRILTLPLLSVEDSMRNAPLTTGDGFHRDVSRVILICSSQYRTLRKALQRGKKDGDAELQRSLQQCAETFASHLIPMLRITLDRCMASLSLKEQSAGNVEGIQSNLDFDLQLLTSSLTTLLHQDSALSAFVWLPKFHTTSVLQTALDLFSRSPLATSVDGKRYEASLFGGHVPTFWRTLLPFFLNLACQPSTVEPLILAGAVNALSTNAFSTQLEVLVNHDTETASSQARIEPRWKSGGASENALYGQWIKIVQVCMALICSLDPSPQHALVQGEVMSFFKIFHALIEACLNRALMDAVNASGTSLTISFRQRQQGGAARKTDTENESRTGLGVDSVMLDQLQELQLITGLYMHVVRSQLDRLTRRPQVKGGYIDTISSSYIGSSTIRLQEVVHLLQHPHELKAFLNAPDGDKVNTEKAVRHLVHASTNIIDTFWMLTRGVGILCSSDANDWRLDDVVIVPTIGTSPSRPATTGTLLDFASYVCDTLRVRRDQDQDALVTALEQTLALATVQLALCMHGTSSASIQAGADTNDAAKSLAQSARIHTIEVEAGLGRDVVQATESAKSVLQSLANTQGRSGEGRTPSLVFLDVVLTFQRRWLISNE